MNLEDFTKAEIVKMYRFRCIHGHRGIEHPTCYSEAKGGGEKVGYLDIETFSMDFAADYGCILTYAILGEDGELITNAITADELISEESDKRLVKDLIKDLIQFDRVVTYYGKRFDIPFVRTRAHGHKLGFPEFNSMHHTDVFDIIKHKYAFRRKSLEAACRFFGIPAKGHRFGYEEWRKAYQGDRKAMENILAHNVEDVESLRALYKLVKSSVKLTKSSI